MTDNQISIQQDDIELIDMPFCGKSIIVRIYWGPRDGRAKLLCLSGYNNATSPKSKSCMPLSILRVVRVESCLQFRRWNVVQESSELWLCLKFTTWQRLVLFHCMVMALKAQGPFESETRPSDYVISGDTLKFHGCVYFNLLK